VSGSLSEPLAVSTAAVSRSLLGFQPDDAGHAYGIRQPFSLKPDAIWYCIAHEVAVHINQNQDRYRGYFTTSAQKETLAIRDDSLVYGGDPQQWTRVLPCFREPIYEKVPRPAIDLFLPQFTTSTEESQLAILVLFLNILANYYEINVSSLCGIPAIRIEGDASDWRKIVHRAELASHEFNGLHDYFADLIPVLNEIAGVAGGDEPDPVFWRSIYKFESFSGGGIINGWVTTLIAHNKYKSGKFELRDKFDWRGTAENTDPGGTSLAAVQVPSHFSKVPFTWHYLGQRYNMLDIIRNRVS
jgi:hypothetical protein